MNYRKANLRVGFFAPTHPSAPTPFSGKQGRKDERKGEINARP
jgi:hypothetical protein